MQGFATDIDRVYGVVCARQHVLQRTGHFERTYEPANSLVHQLGLTFVQSATGSGTPLQVGAAVVATQVPHIPGHFSDTVAPTDGLEQDAAPTNKHASGSWTPLHLLFAVTGADVVVVQLLHSTGHVAETSKRPKSSVVAVQNGARSLEQIGGSKAPLQRGSVVVVVVSVVVDAVADDVLDVVVTTVVLSAQVLQSTGQRLWTALPNNGSEHISTLRSGS